jgi:protein tyrosine phosphatase (PTP) superfamily phosphohydrolase (DUF442 family)
VGRFLTHERLKVTASLSSTFAPAIGYLELAGLRFPVRQYQSQVSPDMRRGSRIDGSGVLELKKQGYKAIISLTAEKNAEEHETASALGLHHYYIPIIDNTTPTKNQMKQFLDLVSDPRNQPVYVHCQAGKGRTGMAVAARRMAIDGWPVGKAVAEAHSFGLRLRSQTLFMREFGRALAKGEIPGYSLRASTQAIPSH